MIRSAITGVGAALPRRVMKNADLAGVVETSDEWIVQRTGIRQRHIAEPEETTASLGEGAARAALADAGLGPDDIDTAVIYDHFTPLALPQLEEFGFCKKGEAKDFIADGNIELGGDLPINTHGGQLGEAYIHGMNGIAEGVRQVRGTSVNQVTGVEHVLVTAGTAVPTSALILAADDA